MIGSPDRSLCTGRITWRYWKWRVRSEHDPAAGSLPSAKGVVRVIDIATHRQRPAFRAESPSPCRAPSGSSTTAPRPTTQFSKSLASRTHSPRALRSKGRRRGPRSASRTSRNRPCQSRTSETCPKNLRPPIMSLRTGSVRRYRSRSSARRDRSSWATPRRATSS